MRKNKFWPCNYFCILSLIILMVLWRSHQREHLLFTVFKGVSNPRPESSTLDVAVWADGALTRSNCRQTARGNFHLACKYLIGVQSGRPNASLGVTCTQDVAVGLIMHFKSGSADGWTRNLGFTARALREQRGLKCSASSNLPESED